jgi:hypothetical protein
MRSSNNDDTAQAVEYPAFTEQGAFAGSFIGASPLGGFASAQQEATDMHLEDTGFVMRAASPQQLERLRATMPSRRFVVRTVGDRHYYLDVDPDLCKCVFLGDDMAMQNYRALVSPPVDDMDPGLSNSIAPGDILDY